MNDSDNANLAAALRECYARIEFVTPDLPPDKARERKRMLRECYMELQAHIKGNRIT